MANIDCLPQVHICALRVAELDANGVPTPGMDTLITVDSIVELTVTPVVREGQTITELGGQGTPCIDYQGDDSIVRADIAITVCDNNPHVLRALGRGTVLTDAGVNGYAWPSLGPVPADRVSIEYWAKRIEDGDLANENPYAWWVLPKVTNLRQGPITANNGAQRPTFTGRAFENPNWFDGPLNDWPVESDRFLQWFPVPELPVVSCEPTDIVPS